MLTPAASAMRFVVTMLFVPPHLIEALVHGGMTRRRLRMSLDDMKQFE